MPEIVQDNPTLSVDMDDVRRQWGAAVRADAREDATIKMSALAATEGSRTTGKTTAPFRSLVVQDNPADGDTDQGDFVLGELLGKGGMGLVFRAGQTGLERDVALKMVALDRAADIEAQTKLISEARVTGQLDHPNIIPIYELASAPDGMLFYTMKEVRGRPWSEAMSALSEAENIDILLKVADAVAFAHDRGVIHRDLKPENVMLGDYGEVLLMDWGLAAGIREGAKAERLSALNARNGTPAYMAPEMAAAEPDRIGPASDVYLLGAILHEILTGLRPHTGPNVFACIVSALQNDIQPSARSDEWMDIARKALATEPAERYAEVKTFQRAIRDGREHAASLAVSKDAGKTLEQAKASGKYADYARATFGFEEALRLWAENAAAANGVAEARLEYAQRAFARGDYDLASEWVRPLRREPSDDAPRSGAGDSASASRAEDIDLKAKAAKRRVDAHAVRSRWMTRVAVALTVVVTVMSLAVAYWMRSRNLAMERAEQARLENEAAQARAAEAEKASLAVIDDKEKAEASLVLIRTEGGDSESRKQFAALRARLASAERDNARLIRESDRRAAELAGADEIRRRGQIRRLLYTTAFPSLLADGKLEKLSRAVETLGGGGTRWEDRRWRHIADHPAARAVPLPAPPSASSDAAGARSWLEPPGNAKIRARFVLSPDGLSRAYGVVDGTGADASAERNYFLAWYGAHAATDNDGLAGDTHFMDTGEPPVDFALADDNRTMAVLYEHKIEFMKRTVANGWSQSNLPEFEDDDAGKALEAVPNGDWVLLTRAGRLYRIENNVFLFPLDTRRLPASSFALSPDGKMAVGFEDGRVAVGRWNENDAPPQWLDSPARPTAIAELAINHGVVACRRVDGAVDCWPSADAEPVRLEPANDGGVTATEPVPRERPQPALALNERGDRLFMLKRTRTGDKVLATLVAWDTETGERVHREYCGPSGGNPEPGGSDSLSGPAVPGLAYIGPSKSLFLLRRLPGNPRVSQSFGFEERGIGID